MADRLQQQYLDERRSDKRRRAKRRAGSVRKDDGKDAAKIRVPLGPGCSRAQHLARVSTSPVSTHSSTRTADHESRIMPGSGDLSQIPGHQRYRIERYCFSALISWANAYAELEELSSLPPDRLRSCLIHLSSCNPEKAQLNKQLLKLEAVLRPHHSPFAGEVQRLVVENIATTQRLVTDLLRQKNPSYSKTNSAQAMFTMLGHVRDVIDKVSQTVLPGSLVGTLVSPKPLHHSERMAKSLSPPVCLANPADDVVSSNEVMQHQKADTASSQRKGDCRMESPHCLLLNTDVRTYCCACIWASIFSNPTSTRNVEQQKAQGFRSYCHGCQEHRRSIYHARKSKPQATAGKSNQITAKIDYEVRIAEVLRRNSPLPKRPTSAVLPEKMSGLSLNGLNQPKDDHSSLYPIIPSIDAAPTKTQKLTLAERFATLRKATAFPIQTRAGSYQENQNTQGAAITSHMLPIPDFSPAAVEKVKGSAHPPPTEITLSRPSGQGFSVPRTVYTAHDISKRISQYLAAPRGQFIPIRQDGLEVHEKTYFVAERTGPLRLEAVIPAFTLVSRDKSPDGCVSRSMLAGLPFPLNDHLVRIQVLIKSDDTLDLCCNEINLNRLNFISITPKAPRTILKATDPLCTVFTQITRNKFLQVLPRHLHAVDFAEQTGAVVIVYTVLRADTHPNSEYSWVSSAPAFSIEDGSLTKGLIRRHAASKLGVESRSLGLWYEDWPEGKQAELSENATITAVKGFRRLRVGVIPDPYIRIVVGGVVHTIDVSSQYCNKVTIPVGQIRRIAINNLMLDDKHDVQLFYDNVELRDDALSVWALGLLPERVTQGSEPFYVHALVSLAVKTCSVCVEDKHIRRFPAIITSACHDYHGDITVCNHCIRTWIWERLTSHGWDKISCPECSSLLQHADIRRMARARDFERYDGLATRAALAQIPGFTWCRNSGCTSGQIHDETISGPLFRCGACGHAHCTAHGVHWHTGETCADYDDRVINGSRRRASEERKSRDTIAATTKKCPKCTVDIEKNDGCDHMTCRRCRHEFCWLCLAEYGAIRLQGNSAHRKGCSHWRRG